MIEDESEYPHVVAYHTLTAEGLPQVKIAVVNAKQTGWEWTMAASHDLMEMLANPMLNLTVFVPAENGTTGKLYVREICDPVSSPEYSLQNRRRGGVEFCVPVVVRVVSQTWEQPIRLTATT